MLAARIYVMATFVRLIVISLHSLVSGGLVLLALAFLTSLFRYIPEAALAGVIIIAVIDMADFQLVKVLWRVKSKIKHFLAEKFLVR